MNGKGYFAGAPARCPGDTRLSSGFSDIFQATKTAQRGGFWDGYLVDIQGSFARISRPKTSVRALEILKKEQHVGVDIHDPKARTSTSLRDLQKLRSEELWAEFSFPNFICDFSYVPSLLPKFLPS